MREGVKLKLLLNIIDEVTRKYEELLKSYESLTHRLEFEASHDPLTGLFNRKSLETLLRMELNRNKILNNGNLEVLFIDLDRFKEVNDRYGHKVGDEVLKKIAQIIRDSIRSEDIPVRYGGDEFVIILKGKERGIGKVVGERIRRKIEESFKEFGISASYGIAVYPEDGETPEELIEVADKRMYEMKLKKKKTKEQAVS
ncbi:GGDEF domain-containing protein [Aquifex pyrophilus]